MTHQWWPLARLILLKLWFIIFWFSILCPGTLMTTTLCIIKPKFPSLMCTFLYVLTPNFCSTDLPFVTVDHGASISAILSFLYFPAFNDSTAYVWNTCLPSLSHFKAHLVCQWFLSSRNKVKFASKSVFYICCIQWLKVINKTPSIFKNISLHGHVLYLVAPVISRTSVGRESSVASSYP